MVVGETDWVPEVAFVPVQPPEAVQLVALVELQVRVLEFPEVMLEGEAERVTTGAGVGAGGGVVPPVVVGSAMRFLEMMSSSYQVYAVG